MTRHPASLAPALGLAIVGRTVHAVLRQLGDLMKANANRRQIKLLAEFDDRVLKDIGLLRSDVDGALAEPFYRDPTRVLVRTYPQRGQVQRRAGAPVAGLRPVVPLVKAGSRA